MQKLLSLMMIAAGLILMALKVASDREPGGIPVMLVAVGTVWFLVVRTRRRG